MTRTSILPALRSVCLAVFVVLTPCFDLARPTSANWQGVPDRNVVMFGVLATPNSNAMDSKISAPVAAQLRRTLPGHGFKLIQIKSARVMTGQSVNLTLGSGFVATTQLLNPLDPNGKVQMSFELAEAGTMQFKSIVVTPADQFNFFDKMLPNNDHLLIAVGAR
jgi:hypothetical protein